MFSSFSPRRRANAQAFDPDAVALRAKARRATIRALAAKGRPVLCQSRWQDGCTYLVHLDSARPGQWRITRFEGEEPIGHIEPTGDLANALDVAHWNGADVSTAAAPEGMLL